MTILFSFIRENRDNHDNCNLFLLTLKYYLHVFQRNVKLGVNFDNVNVIYSKRGSFLLTENTKTRYAALFAQIIPGLSSKYPVKGEGIIAFLFLLGSPFS